MGGAADAGLAGAEDPVEQGGSGGSAGGSQGLWIHSPDFGRGDGDAVIDPAGNVTVFWLEEEDGFVSVFSRYFSAASESWGDIELLEEADGNAERAFIAGSLDGDAVVTWLQRGTDVKRHLWANVRDSASGTWSGPTEVAPLPVSGQFEFAWAGFGKSGDVHVAWLDVFGSLATLNRQGGSWSEPLALGQGVSPLIGTVGFATNSNDDVLFYFDQSVDDDGWCAIALPSDEATWKPLSCPTGIRGSASVVLDDDGVASVSAQSENGAVDVVALQHIDVRRWQWSEVETVDANAIANAAEAVLSRGADGGLVLVWPESGNVQWFSRAVDDGWSVAVPLSELQGASGIPTDDRYTRSCLFLAKASHWPGNSATKTSTPSSTPQPKPSRRFKRRGRTLHSWR
jgi:hypothetical protein